MRIRLSIALGGHCTAGHDDSASDAVRKRPRFTGDDGRIDGPVEIAGDERAVAEAALAPVADRILYGRVDVARDAAGQPMVMELELIEPSLYLTRCPRALDRFVAAIRRALAAQPPGAIR
jgi:hypothetical protein